MPALPASPNASFFSILLVDDNPHGQVARKRVLTELGYLVQTVLSAEEALRLIEDKGEFFHVVVTDLRMTGMDGVELIARLKHASPRTRTVLLSGFVDPLGLTEETTGADAVISKCASEVAQLTRAVKALLARRLPRKPVASEARAANASMVKSV